MTISKCPICGETPMIFVEPLRHYYGCNDYHMKHSSESYCPMAFPNVFINSVDDVYRSREEAYNKLTEEWNDYCNTVRGLLNSQAN